MEYLTPQTYNEPHTNWRFINHRSDQTINTVSCTWAINIKQSPLSPACVVHMLHTLPQCSRQIQEPVQNMCKSI